LVNLGWHMLWLGWEEVSLWGPGAWPQSSWGLLWPLTRWFWLYVKGWCDYRLPWRLWMPRGT
jgi:hypothetical protein